MGQDINTIVGRSNEVPAALADLGDEILAAIEFTRGVHGRVRVVVARLYQRPNAHGAWALIASNEQEVLTVPGVPVQRDVLEPEQAARNRAKNALLTWCENEEWRRQGQPVLEAIE